MEKVAHFVHVVQLVDYREHLFVQKFAVNAASLLFLGLASDHEVFGADSVGLPRALVAVLEAPKRSVQFEHQIQVVQLLQRKFLGIF